MMREMIQRRLNHPEWETTDLILVDGGKGKLNGVKFEVPIYGLAKRMEWLYTPDGSVMKLSRSSPALHLLQKLRDEAYRFAITYHRKLCDIIKL